MILDRLSLTPLYLQLAQHLRELIRSGDLHPGMQLPTERVLAQDFQVSRNTVRLAIDQLANGGLIERIQGRGTFVTTPKLKLGLMRLTSFTEDMSERQLDPSSKLLHRSIERPPPEIAAEMKLGPHESMLLIERLRYADGIPMALNVSYFSLQLCSGLLHEDLEKNSIYSLLENKFGLRMARAEQCVRAIMASDDEAELLAVQPGSPLLVIEGVVFLEDERRVEYLRSFYRADRYEFEINPIRFPI
jgi:GntR family transcriptional regulator